MQRYLAELASCSLPKSALGKAVSYACNQWQALRRYTEDGRLSIDNNVSERTLRHQAIGRKNWLFLGSKQAGPRAAVLFTSKDVNLLLNNWQSDPSRIIYHGGKYQMWMIDLDRAVCAEAHYWKNPDFINTPGLLWDDKSGPHTAQHHMPANTGATVGLDLGGHRMGQNELNSH